MLFTRALRESGSERTVLHGPRVGSYWSHGTKAPLVKVCAVVLREFSAAQKKGNNTHRAARTSAA